MRRRYAVSNASADAGLDEPCTINADVIAKFLEEHGKPRMAAFVRRLGDDNRDKNVMESEFARQYNALLERLYVYEPPPLSGPVDHRSEWD